jgi:IclR family pca regulon transcriptional regulator
MSMRLGFACLNRLPLVELAQPILDRLRAEVRASTHMAILEDKSLVYVALSRTHVPTAINIHVGSRMPAYASSIGRILLAYQTTEDLDRVLGTDPIPALTPRTTVDQAEFRDKLAQARHDGYLFNDEEFQLGIRSIAAPVFDAHGTAVAGINATALTTVFGDDRVQGEIIPAVVRSAAEISRGLGFSGDEIDFRLIASGRSRNGLVQDAAAVDQGR